MTLFEDSAWRNYAELQFFVKYYILYNTWMKISFKYTDETYPQFLYGHSTFFLHGKSLERIPRIKTDLSILY